MGILFKKMDKKRARENDAMEEDEDMFYDQIPAKEKLNLSSTSGDQDVDMNGEVNIEFLFSELRPTYFHPIKTFLKPIFEYENVSMSELADIILDQAEVGSVIKTELEEDTGNQNVDLFALITMLNMNHYKDKNVFKQIKNFLNEKINKYANEQFKTIAKNIVDSENFAFFINERAVNLPMPLIPPLLNMIKSDIDDYKEDEDNKGCKKFDFDYVCMASKFVEYTGDEGMQNKKRKIQSSKNMNEIYYKFEDDYFAKEAVAQMRYKIPYDQKIKDFVENSNEPQYFNILFLKANDFFKVIQKVQSEDMTKFAN